MRPGKRITHQPPALTLGQAALITTANTFAIAAMILAVVLIQYSDTAPDLWRPAVVCALGAFLSIIVYVWEGPPNA